jgi:Mitochondrial carrier protein
LCKNPQFPEVFETFLVSASSSTIAAFLTSPLDMAKLRMQIQRGERAVSGETGRPLEKGTFGYRNMFHGIYLIYSKEGFLALYKGIVFY